MTTRDNGATKFVTVRYEPKGAICHIVLNRPEKLNAANDQLVEEVNDALFEFDADPELKVAIISGAGRAFCSGADVRQRQLRTREELKRLGGPAGRRSRESGLGDAVNWKPVIAAVHGYALGLGYSLSQSCDLVVAAEGTQLQIREVQRGLASGQHWVSTWFWTGSRFANEVALTGRMFTAEEALQQGMVNRVVPQADLMTTAEALAAQIIDNPPLAVRAVVRTGVGRACSAGADLKNPRTHTVESPEQHLANLRGNPVFDAVETYPKPIISAVNGYAIGIGCLVPLCCDFIFASEQAVFCLPQVSLGILPAYGGTLRLARFVGRGNAMNIALTGRKVGADDALRMGMVVDVLPQDTLIPEAIRTMQAIGDMPVSAVRLARESLRLGYEGGLAATAQADLYRFMALSQTSDRA